MSDLIIVSQNSNDNSPLKSLKLNGESKKPEAGIKCKVDLGSGDTKCCVSNCSTNSLHSEQKSQVTFITFPKDPSRFTEWTRAVGRPDLLAFIGKKEATNLLVCYKHFPENMWINSNTRNKRLHKNAVPDLDSDDDEIDIIAESPNNSARKGGLKVKKVSSLLTESALRETFTPVSSKESTNLVSSILYESPSQKSVRKYPQFLQSQKLMGKTDLEKKLIFENEQLKSELDKNMDSILNQKAHYEGILLKEKQKSAELENKVRTLDAGQKKLWHTYESQLQAQRTVASSKEAGHHEMASSLRTLEFKNSELEKKLAACEESIVSLEEENLDLESKVHELLRDNPRSPSPSPEIEPNFMGEQFKEFMHHHLQKEKQLKKDLTVLRSELGVRSSEDGRKRLVISMAKEFLNEFQLSLVEYFIEKTVNDYAPSHFREFCLALIELSQESYALCEEKLGLPPLETVRTWVKQAETGSLTSFCAISSLYDENSAAAKRQIKSDTSPEREMIDFSPRPKSKEKSGNRKWNRNPPAKRKREYEESTEEVDDENLEEGRVSDEEEELLFSEESDEEGINPLKAAAPSKPFDLADEISSSSLPSPQPSSTCQQADFDFMLETEDQSNSTLHIGSSMPLLVPDSPLATLPNLGPQPTPEVKVGGRKKVISSEASLNSGPKVVFRVIE